MDFQSLTWQSRELLNIALAKNKIGETMVLKFVSFSKARRSLESRRRSCGDRKVDLLGREGNTSPGKVAQLIPSFST